MIISGRQAQDIVDELARSIQKKINIMDETGRIVASTDPDRIGSYHAGARKIIREKLDELLISPSECYEGAKEGVNLPIVLENKIVGVVGISGSEENVVNFGKIIKKLTEVMIMDRYQENQKQKARELRNSFLSNWIFGSQEDTADFSVLKTSGKFLGIDIEKARIVAVLNVKDKNETFIESITVEERQRQCDKILHAIEKWLKYESYNKQDIVLQMEGNIAIFFDSNNYSTIKKTVQRIAYRIETEFKVIVYGGIGTVGRDRAGIRSSFKEAEIACNVAEKNGKSRVKDYNNMDMELLIENIPDYEKKSFVEKIFNGCSEEQISDWIKLLHCYIENNGSINKTADQLYIHKNTLQYRLGKLKEITGYDPRNISELILLYTAVLIWEQNKNILNNGVFTDMFADNG